MNFFKQVDLDWMGKAKYFFALSGLLLLAGVASIVAHHGLFYGIDFKGGTVVDVRFAAPACRHDSQRDDAAGNVQFHDCSGQRHFYS